MKSYSLPVSETSGGLITTTVAPQPAQPGRSFLDPLRARFGGVFGAFLQPIFEIFGALGPSRMGPIGVKIGSKRGATESARCVKLRNISRRHGNSAPSQTGSSRSIPGCGALLSRIWLRQRGELETLQRLGKCDVLLVADTKELASLVAELPADAGIDPAIEQQIDQHLGRLAEALTWRDEILAVLH